MPYENDRFELVALMPIESGLDQGRAAMKSILAKIGDKLDSWLADPSPYETRVYLPKVDLTDTTQLKDPLKALGMPSAFSPFTPIHIIIRALSFCKTILTSSRKKRGAIATAR